MTTTGKKGNIVAPIVFRTIDGLSHFLSSLPSGSINYYAPAYERGGLVRNLFRVVGTLISYEREG